MVIPQEELKRLVRDTHYSEQEIMTFYQKFKTLDYSGKGYISVSNLKCVPGLSRLAISELICNTLTEYSSDGSTQDVVDFSRLIQVMSAHKQNQERAKMTFLFSIYDIDGDGRIGEPELTQVLKYITMNALPALSEEQLHEIVTKTMVQYAVKKPGWLHFDEFCRIFEERDTKQAAKKPN